MIPELVARRADKLLDEFCARHGDRLGCPQVNLIHQWQADAVILSFRDGCNEAQPMARFLYSAELNQWTLASYEPPHSWRVCLEVPPSLNMERLLHYLDQDPLNHFWPPAFTCFS